MDNANVKGVVLNPEENFADEPNKEDPYAISDDSRDLDYNPTVENKKNKNSIKDYFGVSNIKEIRLTEPDKQPGSTSSDSTVGSSTKATKNLAECRTENPSRRGLSLRILDRIKGSPVLDGHFFKIIEEVSVNKIC